MNIFEKLLSIFNKKEESVIVTPEVKVDPVIDEITEENITEAMSQEYANGKGDED